MTKTIYTVEVRTAQQTSSIRYLTAEIAGSAFAILAAQAKPGELVKVTVGGKIIRMHRG